MTSRLVKAAVAVAVVALAVMAAATTASADTTTLKVVGPWKGADATSFRAVLDAFQQQNTGVQVTYAAADASVAKALPTADADVALMSLPTDLQAFKDLARAGTLKTIGFAAPAVKANYAFTWKSLGTVDGTLYGVFFKATNDSALWFNRSNFDALGISSTPTSFAGLRKVSDAIAAKGRKPFAISGNSGTVLPNLFANVFLMQQGAKRYDMLASGELKWTSSVVRDSASIVRNVFLGPKYVAGGLEAALKAPFGTAVQKVFGSPQTASILPGGSMVIPVLTNAKAVRPITGFGVIPFPSLNAKAPPRVVGQADAAVMVKDSPAAQALIAYLATPEAATVWAKRGGVGFLSPNRKVDPATYGVPAIRTLATSLAAANVFRFNIAEMLSPSARAALDRALADFARTPGQFEKIAAGLQAVAEKPSA